MTCEDFAILHKQKDLAMSTEHWGHFLQVDYFNVSLFASNDFKFIILSSSSLPAQIVQAIRANAHLSCHPHPQFSLFSSTRELRGSNWSKWLAILQSVSARRYAFVCLFPDRPTRLLRRRQIWVTKCQKFQIFARHHLDLVKKTFNWNNLLSHLKP